MTKSNLPDDPTTKYLRYAAGRPAKKPTINSRETNMNDNKIDGIVIDGIERIRNSRYGNPTFRVFTSMGTFLTETDASLGYGIENLTNSRRPDEFVIGTPQRPAVTLHVT